MSNSSSELSSSSSSSLSSSFSASRLLSSILKCLSFSLSSSLLGVSRFTSDFFTFSLSFWLFSSFNLLHTKNMNACLQENKRTRNYNNHYYILCTLYIKCPKNIGILRRKHEENLNLSVLFSALRGFSPSTLVFPSLQQPAFN